MKSLAALFVPLALAGTASAQTSSTPASDSAAVSGAEASAKGVGPLRRAVADYYTARAAGDEEGAAAAAAKARDAWLALPPAMRDRIEARHPGTLAHLKALPGAGGNGGSDAARDAGAGQARAREGRVICPNGKEFTSKDAVGFEETRTGPDGRVVVRDGTVTRSGDSVTRVSQITGADGQVHSLSSTWTSPDGKSIFHGRNLSVGPGRGGGGRADFGGGAGSGLGGSGMSGAVGIVGGGGDSLAAGGDGGGAGSGASVPGSGAKGASASGGTTVGAAPTATAVAAGSADAAVKKSAPADGTPAFGPHAPRGGGGGLKAAIAKSPH
jgi:hypothetical protein